MKNSYSSKILVIESKLLLLPEYNKLSGKLFFELHTWAVIFASGFEYSDVFFNFIFKDFISTFWKGFILIANLSFAITFDPIWVCWEIDDPTPTGNAWSKIFSMVIFNLWH